MRAGTFAAVDLGASSGRVLIGAVSTDRLDADVVHRFDNSPVETADGLCWDLDALWDGVLGGIAAAAERAPVSVGIDSWAVDYGLLDDDGALLHTPYHYRDDRTAGVVDRVRHDVGAEHIYARTGLALQPFNTIYQLLAEPPERLARAAHLLLIPDLLGHRLTGGLGSERTNSSTTQLYDPDAGEWADDLVAEVGLPRRILGALRDPGTTLGLLRPDLATQFGSGLQVVTVASHDTASAVVAVPAVDDRFAYISCGTWSLVGLELDAPVRTPAGLAANFTNEVGIDGSIRFLRNVMGLWLLQECLQEWQRSEPGLELSALLTAAAHEPADARIDADDPEFFAPGDMAGRIARHCERRGTRPPATPAATTRCILDSLADAHARAVDDACRLADREIDMVHLVGGGSRNSLLCQLTADACGRPVIAGPVEATAIGNLLVQARAVGVLRDRTEMRDLCRRTQQLQRYEPGT